MIRLAKKIAESGIASRREAEQLIKSNRVSVDEQIVSTPVFFVNDENTICIDGKPISVASDELVVWKMNKPRGYLTTRTDPKGRKTVFELFDKSMIDQRLIYIGRLDYNSEGLLLFTNDGNFSRKLELPATSLPRTYKVRFHGQLTPQEVARIEKGIKIDGINYGSVTVKLLDQNKGNNWAFFTLREGKNREIRKILEYFGCTVNRLIRISYGSVNLGDLPVGKIIKLSPTEVKKLAEMARFLQ